MRRADRYTQAAAFAAFFQKNNSRHAVPLIDTDCTWRGILPQGAAPCGVDTYHAPKGRLRMRPAPSVPESRAAAKNAYRMSMASP